MKANSFTILLASLALAVAASQNAGAMGHATAKLKNAEGGSVGEVTLTQTPHGTLLHAKFVNLPPGAHAYHVHTVGKCEPPFKSAGGHYNPEGKKHGFLAADGLHAGDMPNIHVPASGALEIEVLNTLLKLDSNLFDADGAAIVLHAGPDDYKTDPAGAAGGRIACGVIAK